MKSISTEDADATVAAPEDAENWLVEYPKRPAPYKAPAAALPKLAVFVPYKELPAVKGVLVFPYWKSKKNTKPAGKFIG